jgi:hypothetical protein
MPNTIQYNKMMLIICLFSLKPVALSIHFLQLCETDRLRGIESVREKQRGGTAKKVFAILQSLICDKNVKQEIERKMN